MKRVVVVDYGTSNLFSVERALQVSGADEVIISNKAADLAFADGLVLPGVGAFADGMQGLRDRGLIGPIGDYARSGQPVLAICLGMQMLSSVSDEFGHHRGLDLIPGKVVAIPRQSSDGKLLKVPFIGWAEVVPVNRQRYAQSILGSCEKKDSVYLVHSFYVQPTNPEHALATYIYGGIQITAAIQADNVVGLQFHPERSGKVGLSIMRNFVSGL